MADFGDIIGGLLEDPSTVKKLQGVLAQLGEENAPSLPPAAEKKTKPDREEVHPASAKGSLDEAKLQQMLTLLRSKQHGEDDRCRLLYALRPYLSHGRRDRLERSIQMLRTLELLDMMGGIDHV